MAVVIGVHFPIARIFSGNSQGGGRTASRMGKQSYQIHGVICSRCFISPLGSVTQLHCQSNSGVVILIRQRYLACSSLVVELHRLHWPIGEGVNAPAPTYVVLRVTLRYVSTPLMMLGGTSPHKITPGFIGTPLASFRT